MKSFLILFTLLLPFGLGAEKVAELPEVLKPQRIAIEGDKLIVSQQNDYRVHVYSLKNYSLISKFGKKGEGPGEVKRPPHIFPQKESILLYNRGKLLWFKQNGKLIKEKKVGNAFLLAVKPVNNNYLSIQNYFSPKDLSHTVKFFLQDINMRGHRELYSGQRDANSADSKGFRQFKMVSHFLGGSTYKDRIVIGDSRKGFYFEVFDSNGKHIRTINHKLDRTGIDRAYKEKVIEELKLIEKELWPMVKNVMHFYKYYPQIRNFFISEGRIYVTTYREKDNKHEIIIMNLNGRILKRIYLPVKTWQVCRFDSSAEDLFTIKNSKLYELVDNEEEEIYELHITDISHILPK